MKKHMTLNQKRDLFIGGWIIAGAVVLVIFMAFGQAMAQNEPAQPAENAPAKPAKNLNEHFRGKYQFNDADFLISEVRQTPNGPKGRLGISANITMGNIKALPNEYGQARALAEAFIEEEASVLGITDIKEIHEAKVHRNEENTTFILYTRVINGLELDGMYLHVAIRPDGVITSVDATLVPVSPEVYEATTKNTLSKEQISRIVGQDMRSFPLTGGKPDLSSAKFQKYAIPDAPYVIWDVKADRHYRIDAFTGEILRKTEMRSADFMR